MKRAQSKTARTRMVKRMTAAPSQRKSLARLDADFRRVRFIGECRKKRGERKAGRIRCDEDGIRWVTLPNGVHIMVDPDGIPLDPDWGLTLLSSSELKETDKKHKAIQSYCEKFDKYELDKHSGDDGWDKAAMAEAVIKSSEDYENFKEAVDKGRAGKLDFDEICENIDNVRYYAKMTDTMSSRESRDILAFAEAFEELIFDNVPV